MPLQITRQNPRSQQSVQCALFRVSYDHDMFRPSSDFFVTQNIKKRVTICCNGSVDSNGKIISKFAVV
jgi:hypothetical protein